MLETGPRAEPGLDLPRPSRIGITLLLAASLCGSSPAAQLSGEPPYVVPAAAFQLDGSSGTDYSFSFGGGYLQQAGNATSCFQSGVYLPQGFRIGEVVLHAYDANTLTDLSIQLERLSHFDQELSSMAASSTSGNAGMQSPADTSLVGSAIDNLTYAYFLTTCLSRSLESPLRLYGVRIGACVDPSLVVNDASLASGDDFTACDALDTSGSTSIGSARQVSFVAGRVITLSNGFEVLDSATFSAALDSALLPPP